MDCSSRFNTKAVTIMKKTRFYKLFNPFPSLVFLLGAGALILAGCGGGGVFL